MVDEVTLLKIFTDHFRIPCQFSFDQPLHGQLSSFVAGTVGRSSGWCTSEITALLLTDRTGKSADRLTSLEAGLSDVACVDHDAGLSFTKR
jgi:hypothetical protein